MSDREFEIGDRIINTKRPEWGVCFVVEYLPVGFRWERNFVGEVLTEDGLVLGGMSTRPDHFWKKFEPELN